MNIMTKNQEETACVAADVARRAKLGDVIALYGDLGMGKTVFSRAFIRTLSDNEALEVPSPTFTLVQTYDCAKGAIYHFDCYRLEDPDEIYELGWEDALSDAIVLIEWPERIAGLLPAIRLDISLSSVENEPDHRIIQIKESL